MRTPDVAGVGASAARVARHLTSAGVEWSVSELTGVIAGRMTVAELRALVRRAGHELDLAPPQDVLRWAIDQFGDRFCIAASMETAVLVDMAARIRPGVAVVFIDTGYHFRETLETMERVRRRYGLNLRIMTVAPRAPALWEADPVNCCAAAKLGQLERALIGKAAWMSGLRRVEAPTRANAPVVALDQRGLVKLNPLARWSDDDVSRYIHEHKVPTNPLRYEGYRSIGCAPCTRPVGEGEDPRSGRWADSEKTECGLHL